MEEIADVFAKEEEEEKAECENIKNALEKRLNLNESFNTTGMLEKVKLNLYNTIELYWNKEEKGTLILALLDPKIKSLEFIDDDEIRNKTEFIKKQI
ncbi:3936_t:CDS:1, partial [Funneliformis geosporum]